MTETITIARMYTDSAGDSRFDTYEMPMTLHDHAPPAAPFFTTDGEQATQYILFRLPAGWTGAQHPTPNNRLVICLSGVLRFVGSAGESVTLRPGDKMMDMNTTGKGHSTEVISDGPADGIIIRTD